MLKTKFKTKAELDVYIAEQKIRKDNGYLSYSERMTLQEIIKNPENYIEKELSPFIKKIITDYPTLRIPCVPVTKEDNIDEIIQSLKETLEHEGGLGLSANQIGINKQIAYCKIPKLNSKGKKLEYTEIILINPEIVEKERKILFRNERCISLPDVAINTDRYVFLTVVNHDKDLKEKMFLTQDLESFVIQHESDHINGMTILQRKHKKR